MHNCFTVHGVTKNQTWLRDWPTIALQCCVTFCCIANELYIYTRTHLCFGFPSHVGHHRALNWVPCSMQYVHIGCLICSINSEYMSISVAQFFPLPFFPVAIHVFLLCVHVPISALQVRSSTSFRRVSWRRPFSTEGVTSAKILLGRETDLPGWREPGRMEEAEVRGTNWRQSICAVQAVSRTCETFVNDVGILSIWFI